MILELLLFAILICQMISLILLKEVEENIEDLFYRRRHESLLRRIHDKLFKRKKQ